MTVHRRHPNSRLGAVPGLALVVGGLVCVAALAGLGTITSRALPVDSASTRPAVAMVMEPHLAVAPAPAAPAPTATPTPPPPPPAPPPPPPPPPRPVANVGGLVNTTIACLNNDRAAHGVAALQVSAALNRAAAVHAEQNAAQRQMSHNGLVADVNAQGVSWRSLGETLADESGTPDAGYVNQMWMNSSEHRAIILTAQFTTVGVGWAQAADGSWFVSAIFVS